MARQSLPNCTAASHFWFDTIILTRYHNFERWQESQERNDAQERQESLHWYLNLANMKVSFCDSCPIFFSANLFLEVYSMSEVKRPFKVEEQLLCWILEIEIEEQKWGASANFEGENCGGKRRSHHLGMRECFFDQWIFHSVWQDLFPGFHVVAPARNIFTTMSQSEAVLVAQIRLHWCSYNLRYVTKIISWLIVIA